MSNYLAMEQNSYTRCMVYKEHYFWKKQSPGSIFICKCIPKRKVACQM